MTHLSTYIGQAALQKFFPHLSPQQNTYNPQYNGWDSPEDMPKYNKANQKNDYLKEGQKLNVQLIDQIFKTEQFKNQNNKIKPNLNQNTNNTDQKQKPKQNQQVQNKVNQPNSNNNQQYYNRPIPYNTPIPEQNPNKIHQTQYHTPNINQYSMPVNQSMYHNNLRANNQTQVQHQNTIKEQAKPQNHQTN